MLNELNRFTGCASSWYAEVLATLRFQPSEPPAAEPRHMFVASTIV